MKEILGMQSSSYTYKIQQLREATDFDISNDESFKNVLDGFGTDSILLVYLAYSSF